MPSLRTIAGRCCRAGRRRGRLRRRRRRRHPRKVAPGLALGLIALSLVPLTGWAGQVSLCQMTFAGMGALRRDEGGGRRLADRAPRRGRWSRCPSGRSWRSPPCGSKGCTSALATLAFAVFMDNVFFIRERRVRQPRVGATSSALESLGSPSRASGAYFVLLAAAFAVVAVGLLALRRGRFGRRLSALRDSPVACTMMGMNTTVTKLQVFALSSAIAAVGGVLLAGLAAERGAADYTMFSSLPLVLLAVLGGITAVQRRARRRASSSPGSRCWPRRCPGLEASPSAGPGLIGITLARRPDGLVLCLGDCGRADGDRPAPRSTTCPIARAGRGSRSRRVPFDHSTTHRRSTGVWRSTSSVCDAARRCSSCAGVRAGYGRIEVLHGSTSSCRAARSSGCSDRTAPARAPTLGVIGGQIRPTSGRGASMAGRDVTGAGPDSLARAGVCTIPEGRGVFPNLTVAENILMFTHRGVRARDAEEIAYEHFPLLRERRRAARRAPLRRRAADARARPRARHRSGAAAARRAVDGTGADDRRAALRAGGGDHGHRRRDPARRAVRRVRPRRGRRGGHHGARPDPRRGPARQEIAGQLSGAYLGGDDDRRSG